MAIERSNSTELDDEMKGRESGSRGSGKSGLTQQWRGVGAEDESECGVCVWGGLKCLAWWEGAANCSLQQPEQIRSWLMPRAMRFHSSVMAQHV